MGKSHSVEWSRKQVRIDLPIHLYRDLRDIAEKEGLVHGELLRNIIRDGLKAAKAEALAREAAE